MISSVEQPATSFQRSQTLAMKASLSASANPTGTERTTREEVLGSPAVKPKPSGTVTQAISAPAFGSPSSSRPICFRPSASSARLRAVVWPSWMIHS